MADTATYANPQLLVDTQWLADHLNAPSICIIDCDTRDAYRRAHVPGAVCPKEHYMKGPNSPLIMGPEQFAQEMGELGVGDDTLVVCYDGFGGLYAARMWWCLRYYGHDQCVVVNGGWNKWLSEARPTTYTVPKPTRGHLYPQARAGRCRLFRRRAEGTNRRTPDRYLGCALQGRMGWLQRPRQPARGPRAGRRPSGVAEHGH